jgi:YVTN family beta-propeller protein
MKRALVCALLLGIGCGGESGGDDAELRARAYVISRDHPELAVFDLRTQTIVGRVNTAGLTNHMAELSADFRKVYITSSDTNELVVVDARSLTVQKRVALGKHPTHLSLLPDGSKLAVMIEEEGAVAFVDTAKDEVVKTLPGFYTPHFMRFSHDGRTGYVANLEAYHLTRVDLATLEIRDHLPLPGHQGPPNMTPARDEGGFADAQIARDGRLYAAHRASGRVLIYDTVASKMLPEVTVGTGPWVAFAEHPFANVPLRHLVPVFDDKSLALIDAAHTATMPETVKMLPGDEEAYGVNFSSLAPERAFVMNRIRKDVAVVDTTNGTIERRIDVGGNTETASTTADGAFIVATVSGADRVVFIDAKTGTIAKSFEGMGKYPWSVTIPSGQNYCH